MSPGGLIAEPLILTTCSASPSALMPFLMSSFDFYEFKEASNACLNNNHFRRLYSFPVVWPASVLLVALGSTHH